MNSQLPAPWYCRADIVLRSLFAVNGFHHEAAVSSVSQEFESDSRGCGAVRLGAPGSRFIEMLFHCVSPMLWLMHLSNVS